jgi:hypothetical protein
MSCHELGLGGLLALRRRLVGARPELLGLRIGGLLLTLRARDEQQASGENRRGPGIPSCRPDQ